MNLRTRLVLAAGTVLAVLIAVLVAIVIRQRTVLIDQIDEQLETVAVAITRAPQQGLGNPANQALQRPEDGPPTGDFYFALLLPDGTVRPAVRPVSHPEFAPEPEGLLDRAQMLDRDEPLAVEPFTVDSVDGPGRARTVVVRLNDDLTVVVARSTDRIDEAQRLLAVTALAAVLAVAAILGLVLWWLDRLGLQPINRLTEAAEDVAAGRSERRVEHPSAATETGRLGAAFNTMLDARQEAEDRQRRFVADASHELRTPLTTLRGYAALHASGGLTTDDAVDDAMGRIRVEADRMAALVEDLLTLAALDDERPLDLGPIDLSQLLIDIGRDAAAVQPTRSVENAGVNQGITVDGDQHLLTQAITAVTSNVLRHTPANAGLLLTATTERSDTDDERVVITVGDRGPGIEEDQLPRLFDRFYRADSGRAGSSGGRGLGLSIARTVVHAHGGSIRAESTLEQGTTVTIELPHRGPDRR